MHRWLVLTLAAIPLMLPIGRPSPPSLVWWTTDALEKVKPGDGPPEELNNSVQLYAARNEFESFQVVFRSGSEDFQRIDVDVSDFKSAHGNEISKNNITIYFERYLNLAKPSSSEGEAGGWPDPLIPRVDRYAKEKRNAFPFNLTSGSNQPIWIEVYVPPGTVPGTYIGNLTVRVNEKPVAAIPVEVHVWNFTLPSTSSLPNTFGFNGLTALRQHVGRYTNDADVWRFTSIYRKAALWHRISLHGGSMIPPRSRFTAGGIQVDWEDFDAEVGPFLDGTAIGPGEPLYGAKATTAGMRTPPSLKTDEHIILYWKAVASHFTEKGWMGRLFNYLLDEPKPEHFDEVLREARLVHSADRRIRNLVTAPFHADWTGAIDIWTPLINCFEPKPFLRNFCSAMVDRPGYEGELAKGAELWWYQSCASHGCFIVGREYFRGWPAYIIDTTGVSNRIMPWITWKYDIRGELYYNIDEAYSHNKDPWTNIHLFGGNGDGTLVYPGRPRNIGGITDIPIESIRLKLIREGLEDYEYLVLLTRYTSSSVTKNFVNSLVTNAYTFERDAKKFYEVRRQIGEKINQMGIVSN